MIIKDFSNQHCFSTHTLENSPPFDMTERFLLPDSTSLQPSLPAPTPTPSMAVDPWVFLSTLFSCSKLSSQ